jgi:hypothetical protein
VGVAALDAHPDITAGLGEPPLLAVTHFAMPAEFRAPLRVVQGIRVTVEGAARSGFLQLDRYQRRRDVLVKGEPGQ